MSKRTVDLPKVILHNSISLEGSLTGFEPNLSLHYRLAGRFGAEAHLIGWRTIKTGFETYGGGVPPEEPSDLLEPAGRESLPYWVIPDSRGRLKGLLHACRRAGLCRDVIVLVSDITPERYLHYLETRNYSYRRAGRDHVDLKRGLAFISRAFGVRTVLADTGRILGTRLLELGLVTEISLLVHPVLVGRGAYPIFTGLVPRIELIPLKKQAFRNGQIWLVYGLTRRSR